jgi:hypothetical protein
LRRPSKIRLERKRNDVLGTGRRGTREKSGMPVANYGTFFH